MYSKNLFYLFFLFIKHKSLENINIFDFFCLIIVVNEIFIFLTLFLWLNIQNFLIYLILINLFTYIIGSRVAETINIFY